MRALTLLLLLATVGLSGCFGPAEEQTSARYWELVTTLGWNGTTDGPVLLEQGPHCAWLTHQGDRLALLRGVDDPRPDGHALGRTWSGDLPEGVTTGGGYAWWLHDGTVPRTVGDGALLTVAWDGHAPVLDGEARADGWNHTARYTVDSLEVAETVTLHDHGTLPLTVRTEDEVYCE